MSSVGIIAIRLILLDRFNFVPASDLLLIYPVMLSLLVRDHFSLLKPQRNLFLRALDGVRAVANIPANILFNALATPRRT